MNKTKILIAGIGGIGGYFGGHLAKTFAQDEQTEIYFLARGENLEVINRQGITIKSPDSHFSTKPTAAAANVSVFGVMDYILISVKSYDLDPILQLLKENISDTTVIIPLLNGVEGAQRTRIAYPGALVTEGCANIIVRLQQPGYIEHYSSFRSLHFGIPNVAGRRLEKIQDLFLKAGIDSTLTPKILEQIWFKFIFISAAAATTSFYNSTFGEVRSNPEAMETFQGLVDEAFSLSIAEGISLPAGAKEKVIANFINGPADSTTSMHTDMLSGKGKSELETLVGYAPRRGKELGVETPIYTRVYQTLSAQN